MLWRRRHQVFLLENLFCGMQSIHTRHEKNGSQKKTGAAGWPESIGRCILKKTGADLGQQSSIAPPVAFFLWPTPYFLLLYLVGGTNLMKSCYAGGGPGLARPGKGLAKKNGNRFKKTARAGGIQSSQGAQRKNRKIKTERPRELESSIQGFLVSRMYFGRKILALRH